MVETRPNQAKRDLARSALRLSTAIAATNALERLPAALRNNIAERVVLTGKSILLNRCRESRKMTEGSPALLRASSVFRREQRLRLFKENRFTFVISYDDFFGARTRLDIGPTFVALERAIGEDGLKVLTHVTFHFQWMHKFKLNIHGPDLVRQFMQLAGRGLRLDAIFVNFGGADLFKGLCRHKRFFSVWFKGLIELAYVLQAVGIATDRDTLERNVVAWERRGEGRSLLDPAHCSVLKSYGIWLKQSVEWTAVE